MEYPASSLPLLLFSSLHNHTVVCTDYTSNLNSLISRSSSSCIVSSQSVLFCMCPYDLEPSCLFSLSQFWTLEVIVWFHHSYQLVKDAIGLHYFPRSIVYWQNQHNVCIMLHPTHWLVSWCCRGWIFVWYCPCSFENQFLPSFSVLDSLTDDSALL